MLLKRKDRVLESQEIVQNKWVLGPKPNRLLINNMFRGLPRAEGFVLAISNGVRVAPSELKAAMEAGLG
jgi:hypothetical protein